MAPSSHEGISSDGDRVPRTERRRSSLERRASGDRRPSVPEGRRVSFPRGRVGSLAGANELRYSDRRGSVEGLLTQFSEFANDLNETHETDFTSLQKAIGELEGQIRDTIGEEVRERQEGDRRLEKRCDALERALSSLQRKLGTDDSDKQRVDSLEEKFGAWIDSQTHRIDSLESKFGAWADNQAQDLESLRRAHEIFSQELASFGSAHEQHLEVEQSLDTAVKGLTAAAEQTAKALAAAKAKLELLQEDMQSCEQHCSAEKSKHSAVVERLRQVESKTSALGERVPELERKLESLGGLSRDVGHLRSEHESLARQVKHGIPDRSDPLEWGHGSLVSRHEGLDRDLTRLQDEKQRWPQDINQLRLHVDNARGDLAENPAWEHRAMHNDLDPLKANRSSRQYLAEVTFHNHAPF